MKPSLLRLSLTLALPLAFAAAASAQAPEIIHYTFDSGDATNSAIPGVGNGSIVSNVGFGPGTICTPGLEAVSMGSVARIDTGWVMDLGTGSWSIALHMSLVPGTTAFQYYFGSSSADSFRCFTGSGTNVFLSIPSGGGATINAGAVGGSQNHLAWVYDSTIPEVRTYLNGTLQSIYPQTPGSINIQGTAPDFNVMTYTGTSVATGNTMDEFRFYRRALSASDVSGLAGCLGGFPTFCDPADANSTGAPTNLSGSFGSGVGSDLHLEAVGGPPGEFGYFLIGTGSAEPGIVIGQGHLCLDLSSGSSIGRYNVVGGALNSVGQFDASGRLQNIVGTSGSGSGFDVPSNLPTIGGTIMSGDTWHFQLWHRDTPAGMGESNLSNGLTVMF